MGRLRDRLGDRRLVHASVRRSADPGVTIADFSFTPFSITIPVGGTILWTNNGPSEHTATANDGSFNTGVLRKGQSSSVTFHLPGTFDYHCSIHPFMHGTVVVQAAAKKPPSNTSTSSSGSSGSSSGGNRSNSSGSHGASGSHGSSGNSTGKGTTGSAGSSGTSTASGGTSANIGASGQGTLPFTGVNVLAVAGLGLVLSAGGLFLDRLRRRGLHGDDRPAQ